MRGFFIFIGVLLCLAAGASAASYPNRNVTVLVPANPGGPTDLSTRGVLDAMPEGSVPQGVAFVVSNMAGGSGLIAINKLVGSRNDGYTLGAVNCDFLLNSVTGKTQLTLDNFIPLCFLAADPYAFVVRADAPYKTFKEFVDYAKAHPGEVVIGDTGSGAVPALAVKVMVKTLGLSVKTTSYDGSAPCVVALGSGEINATFTHPSAALGQLQAGTLKALAFSSNARYKLMPDIPAIGELYPKECGDMQILSWITLCALKDTDPAIIAYLQKNLIAASGSDKFKEKMRSLQSQEVTIFTPEGLRKFFAEQEAYYRKTM